MRGKTNLPQDVVNNVDGGVSIPGIDLNLVFKPTAIATSNDLIRVIHAGGHFVAISNKNDIAFSQDGKSWKISRIECYKLKDIIYANGEYIIVGCTRTLDSGLTRGLIARSQDLVNWTLKNDVSVYENSNSDMFSGIAWDGTTFVIGAEGEVFGQSNKSVYVLVSNDLISFTHRKLASDTYLDVRSVLYKNARFLISLYTKSSMFTHNIYCSSDGITFNSMKEDDITNVFYVDGYFLGSKYTGWSNDTQSFVFCRSVNGLNWVKETTTNMVYNEKVEQINNCLFINNTYIFCGTNKGFYLEDLNKIVDVAQEDTFNITNVSDLYSCTFDENIMVLVGSGGVVITADLKVKDKELTIIPSTANQECAVRLSDNLRLVKVPAVTSTIDINIKPENIKDGINILGITGTYNTQIVD